MQASNRLLEDQYTNKIEGMTVSRFGYGHSVVVWSIIQTPTHSIQEVPRTHARPPAIAWDVAMRAIRFSHWNV